MSNIHIFYHVYQFSNWEILYQNQMHSLYLSGLIKNIDTLHIGVIGNTPLFDYPDNCKIIMWEKNYEEANTLKLIKNFCENNLDKKILYFHTKGVTNLTKNQNSWRLFMEYYLIHNWSSCVKLLDEYDTVGVNYDAHTGLGHFPHYSGNFWWANSNYINKLNHDYLDIKLDDQGHSRFYREFWIGSNYEKNKPKMGEVANSGYNNISGARHYYETYAEKNYIN